MSVEDTRVKEITKIGKKLERMIKKKITDHGTAASLLKSLQDLNVSLKVLRKTRIGMIVNEFRKYTRDEEVITLCKSLIKSWKKLLQEPSDPSTSNRESPKNTKKATIKPVSDQSEPSKYNEEDPKSTKKDTTNRAAVKKKRKKDRERKAESPPTVPPTDPVRVKCRELILDALRPEDTSDCSVDPPVLARLIEEHIFEEFKSTESKYKNRVRSRVANLKDTKHPALKDNVLKGRIAPERFATMTAEEMASDDMKDLRAKYTQEAINDHQLSKVDGITSDLFTCEKCGGNNCTYNQVQLLCSDEPMTTFLLCFTCGNRWSFC